MSTEEELQAFWQDLLSGNPARIRRVWGNLTDKEALAVLEHLRCITEGTDWQPEQQQAATLALQVLREQAE